MIPFILTIIGGYLIGNSMKDSKAQFAAGGETEGATVYIDFLNKDKKFQKDRIYFKTYEQAVIWGKENFERFDPDMIQYI